MCILRQVQHPDTGQKIKKCTWENSAEKTSRRISEKSKVSGKVTSQSSFRVEPLVFLNRFSWMHKIRGRELSLTPWKKNNLKEIAFFFGDMWSSSEQSVSHVQEIVWRMRREFTLWTIYSYSEQVPFKSKDRISLDCDRTKLWETVNFYLTNTQNYTFTFNLQTYCQKYSSRITGINLGRVGDMFQPPTVTILIFFFLLLHNFFLNMFIPLSHEQSPASENITKPGKWFKMFQTSIVNSIST